MSIIIGGLINQHTGEILATATTQKEMQALRLQARELNGEPYRPRQEFGFFEFTSALGWDKGFLQRQMQVPIPQQVLDWYREFIIQGLEARAKQLTTELIHIRQARENLSLVDGFDYFDHLIDDVIREHETDLASLLGRIARKRKEGNPTP